MISKVQKRNSRYSEVFEQYYVMLFKYVKTNFDEIICLNICIYMELFLKLLLFSIDYTVSFKKQI